MTSSKHQAPPKCSAKFSRVSYRSFRLGSATFGEYLRQPPWLTLKHYFFLWLGPSCPFIFSSNPSVFHTLVFRFLFLRISFSSFLLNLSFAMSRKAASKPLPKFEIGEDYTLLYALGEGAYGSVVAAVHKPTGRRVAVKKVLPFDHILFALRTLRELKLLKYFSEECSNENIVSVLDIIKPVDFESFNEIYFVQEFMQTDLHRVIRTQPLTDDHCQYFIYQTLRALKTIHSADIVHRDLKPANLLLNANCDLKVCDFGLARSLKAGLEREKPGENGAMTEYVATRWYRAPEIMLSFKMYTKAIDMWAIGCIVAELISGRPLFPGRDYSHQLDLILDIIGTPTLDEFHAITSRRSREYIRSLPIKKAKSFSSLFPHASSDAIDFLNRTLTFDPKKRMTVEEALAHPYVAAYHDAEDEPAAPSLDPMYFQFEEHKEKLSKEQLKELLYEEILSFKSVINDCPKTVSLPVESS